MRRWPIVIVLGTVAACGGSKRQSVPPPETATGPGAGGLLACQALGRAMDALSACARSDDERLVVEHGFERQRELMMSPRPFADDSARIPATRMCLGYLEPLQKQLAAETCAYTPTAQERAWLEAERRRRTPIPAEATGGDREVLAKAAGLRDRACACKAQACYDEVTRELDMGVGSLGPDAPPAARDAASEMIDELMGCGRRLALDLMPTTPTPPPDPAELKQIADAIRAERATAARRKAPPPPVTLADGKRLAVGDCAQMSDTDERDACETLFADVQECQGERDAAAIDACVADAVMSYDDREPFEDDADEPE
jgi:hypothetical protein